MWKYALSTRVERVLNEVIRPAFNHIILTNRQHEMRLVFIIRSTYMLFDQRPVPGRLKVRQKHDDHVSGFYNQALEGTMSRNEEAIVRSIPKLCATFSIVALGNLLSYSRIDKKI